MATERDVEARAALLANVKAADPEKVRRVVRKVTVRDADLLRRLAK